MTITSKANELSRRVIGLAIEVHRWLGPGLLESAYEECSCFELGKAGIGFERQMALPIFYKSIRLDCAYRIDIFVEGEVVLELKAVDRLFPIHEAQILTYLKLSNCALGLLMNFNSAVLKDSLRRFVV
jgi:GxxExxY protein